MKTNKNIRALANINKGIFRALNQYFGYDFEKAFEVYKIDAPFTLKKIEKAIKADLLPMGWASEVVVIMHYTENTSILNRYRIGNTYAVEIVGTGAGDFNIDFGRAYGLKFALDRFYAKYDFNDARKDETLEVFAVVQKKENLARTYHKPEYDLKLERLSDEILNRDYRYSKADFDKSGYYVTAKRRDLINGARELRENRKREAYKATDNSALIEKLQKRVDMAKEIIVSRLEMATTLKEIRQTESALSGWSGYGYALDKLEELKQGEREKSFSSQSRVETLAGEIENRIQHIVAWDF